jgi:hypothetical protein
MDDRTKYKSFFSGKTKFDTFLFASLGQCPELSGWNSDEGSSGYLALSITLIRLKTDPFKLNADPAFPRCRRLDAHCRSPPYFRPQYQKRRMCI